MRPRRSRIGAGRSTRGLAGGGGRSRIVRAQPGGERDRRTLSPGRHCHRHINRPEARNAINLEVIRELTSALDDLAADDQVRALVLAERAGRPSSAGGHRRAARAHPPGGLLHPQRHPLPEGGGLPAPHRGGHRGLRPGRRLELSLACDLRWRGGARGSACRRPRWGSTRRRAGPGGCRGWWGLGRAKELVFTGRILEAEEAFQLGLFERLVTRDRRWPPRASCAGRSPRTRRWRCRWPSCRSTPPPAAATPPWRSGWARGSSSTRRRSGSG